MRGGLRRKLADLVCRALQATLPPSMRSWGWAVRCEAADIEDDTEALLFALDGLRGLLPRAIAARLFHPVARLIGSDAHPIGGSTTMNPHAAAMLRPRAVGIACAIGAVMLGLLYLAMAGAPALYMLVNGGALALGLTMLALLDRTVVAGSRPAGGAILVMAGAILLTALLGTRVEGAARWVSLGGLSIQPSLILLPVMLVAYARTRDAVATAGMVIVAAALALQPDRAMAGMLMAGLAVLAVMRPDRHALAALGVSIAAFAVTCLRPDTLPAVPYVDQIYYESFAIHAAAGAAVLGGSALLLLPAVAGWVREPANRAAYQVFGAAWGAAIAAAALGNYPTPLVGYGGSAILGYALSLLALPRPDAAPAAAGSQGRSASDTGPSDRHLLAGLA